MPVTFSALGYAHHRRAVGRARGGAFSPGGNGRSSQDENDLAGASGKKISAQNRDRGKRLDRTGARRVSLTSRQTAPGETPIALAPPLRADRPLLDERKILTVNNIYQTLDGSPIALSQVKERAESVAAAVRAEYEEAVTVASLAEAALTGATDKTRETLTIARDNAAVTRDALAVKAKSGYKFAPATGRKVNRYAVDDATLALWVDADAAGRAAILAAVSKASTHTQESPFAPSAAAYAAMRGGWIARAGDEPTRQSVTVVMLGDLSTGTFVAPSASRGASSANAVKLTPDQKRDAAALAMFGDLPDAEVGDDYILPAVDAVEDDAESEADATPAG